MGLIIITQSSLGGSPVKRIDHNGVLECLRDAMRLQLVPIPFQSGNADASTLLPTYEQPRPGRNVPTSRESGVTAASLTRQDDPPAHLCGGHEAHHGALPSGGASNSRDATLR